MINTEDVKINTVQVEIKSLMVGKKQLTLSLMRQIIEEYLIDEETLQFKGMPWGHVNYFWGDDKAKSYPTHFNIIWQKGKELRRCVVKSRQNFNETDLSYWYQERKETHKQLSDLVEGRSYWGEAQKVDRKIYLADQLKQWDEHIAQLVYRRDVYLPQYNALIAPLHKLEHFYIAV